MKRDIYQKLLEWKNLSRRKPLLLRGARQVGKTTILNMFGKTEYEDFAYFNFEKNRDLNDFFTSSLDPEPLLQKLSLYRNKKILPHKTLIFFDEIQESQNALESLKYFQEQANDYHIVAAGSLLGVKVGKNQSFPVGKVNFLTLYPLTFLEFLDAVGKSNLRSVIEAIERPEPIAAPFHTQLLEWLKLYFYIGGMPEAVAQYIETQDFTAVREVQNEILSAYELDFSKHAAASEVMKISAVWNSVPGQLAKENKKFIFSAVKKSARGREYEAAIQWLLDAGLIYKSYHLSTPKLPLNAYGDRDVFKVYILDVGLLAAMTDLTQKIFVDAVKIFMEFKGAFTENFIAQELMAYRDEELYYWTSGNTAEVDFVVSSGEEVLPLEVKGGVDKRKKSLLVYDQKYNPNVLPRTTLMNLKRDGKVLNYPLYAMNRLFLV